MEQKHINTDAFATLTVHNMLLQQLITALLAGQEDRGAAFIDQFLSQLRYKLRVPQGADAENGVDPMQLQEVALLQAERFFDSIRTTLSR